MYTYEATHEQTSPPIYRYDAYYAPFAPFPRDLTHNFMIL